MFDVILFKIVYSEVDMVWHQPVLSGMATQVDQKWPLVCHLLTLILHSRYRSLKECDTSFTLFSDLFTRHVRLSEDLNTLHYMEYHFQYWKCTFSV